MKQIRQLLFFILLLNHMLTQAQKANYNQQANFLKANSHWAFRDSAGLDFSSGTAVLFKTSMRTLGACVTLSDPNTGKLLFYSNGEQCWNANHSLMPNGDSLKGNSGYSDSVNIMQFKPGVLTRSSQGVCVAPVIGKLDKYYLFSNSNKGTQNGIYYNIIDMKLNGGLGDIVPESKNLVLTADTLSDAMIVVPGNNCDIWLLTLSVYSSELLAYHITSEGIAPKPVVTNIGLLTSPFSGNCSLNISPDRSKLAMFSGANGIIGEFDASTGKFSNRIDLDLTQRGGSVAFSPDNTKLYCAGFNFIAQHDLTIFNSTAVNGSVQRISTSRLSFNNLRLYNDTIYFLSGAKNIINKIEMPNLSGIACNLEENAIAWEPEDNNSPGIFGNDVVFPIFPDTIFSKLDTTICPKDKVLISAIIKEKDFKYAWNNGETEPEIYLSNNGLSHYWVNYGNFCNRYVDSISISFYDVSTTISINKFDLSATGGPFVSYQWLLNGTPIAGATNSTYTVLENGPYRVIVTTEHGCVDTSDVYPINNYTSIAKENRIADNINIYPNPANSNVYIDAPEKVNVKITDLTGKIVKEQADGRSIYINDMAKGIYLIIIKDEKNSLLKVEKLIKAN